MPTFRLLVCLAAFASLCGAAGGAPRQPDTTQATMDALVTRYPESRTLMRGGRVSAVFGTGMDEGPGPIDAAGAWLGRHVEVFGAGRPDLSPRRVDDMLMTGSSVVVYDQFIDGMPVEGASVRVVVKVQGGQSRVAMVSARLAPAPAAGFAPVAISAEEAVKVVASHPLYQTLQEFYPAELAVYFGPADAEIDEAPTRCYRFGGRGMGPAGPAAYMFFVDSASGRLVAARDEMHHDDVTGVVRGLGSPGMLPDIASNPPVLMTMDDLLVSAGSASTFSGPLGAFLLTGLPTGPATIDALIRDGRWVEVSNNAGPTMGVSVPASAPGSADVLFNAVPSQATTAQVNAFIHQHLARDYFRSRAPTFAPLDTVVPANVNISLTCNAGYDGINNTTNFYSAGNDCVNTAYSSVVAHEYGHHIVNRLGLAQGAFGEGFADTISLLTYDDPVVGRNFRVSSAGFIRHPSAANQQYPCTSTAIHTCGQILGGVWWEIRTRFGQQYGEPAGLELARQLHVDWALITAGGIGLNSAHPQTAIEVLTADDDDTLLDNGTPNLTSICDAFLSRGIACPSLGLLNFQYPNGRPELVAPQGGTLLRVAAGSLNAVPVPGSGTLFVSVDGGAFVQSAMTTDQNGVSSGVFPVIACGSIVRYYVQFDLAGGGSARSPFDAPLGAFEALAGLSTAPVFNDTAETNQGWSLGVPGDTAPTGVWVRGDPIGTTAQPESDTDDAGAQCFFTGQGTVGGAVGDNDVDTGITTLLSPPIDLSTASAVTISYARWYSNNAGGGPNSDTFTVDISANGTTWVNVETIGPAGNGTSGGWIRHTFDPADFVPLSSSVRLRFVASDTGTPSLVEAAVDDLRVEALLCAPGACPGDANQSGSVDFADVTSVLSNFNGPGPLGDANQSGSVDFADVTSVLSNFQQPCP